MIRHTLRVSRALVSGALVSGALVVGATTGLAVVLPGTAHAEDLPIIGGTVTGPGGAPLDNVCVTVYDGQEHAVASTTTGPDGTYVAWVGADGSFRVRFSTTGCSDGNFLPEWYDDAATFAAATPVVIGDGVADDAVDARLAVGATISGTVRAPSGVSLPRGCVEAYDAGGVRATYTVAGAGGAYTLGQLTPGATYRLMFSSCGAENFVGTWYDDATSLATATPVEATLAGTTGIDQVVPRGGRILGQVVDTEGVAIDTQTCVEAYDAAEPYVVDRFVTTGVAYPGSGGSFELYGLPTGAYKLFFRDCDSAGLASEWYQDARTFDTATAVQVTQGSDRTGVVATLAPPDHTAPETTITAGPAQGARVTTGTVTFAFSSNEPGSTFTCTLDDRPLAGCTSPLTLRGLAAGAHTFSVAAIDAAGNADRSPARRSFTVALPDPRCAPATAALTRAQRAVAQDKAKVERLTKRIAQAKPHTRPALRRKLGHARSDLRRDRERLHRAEAKAGSVCR
ncbi:hypothetical protein [Pimelobacter simplex]|uniref:hypothetical protein n=1 Tax=Nocardioides simplex TaxID=2045 RepID=UPI003AAD2C08